MDGQQLHLTAIFCDILLATQTLSQLIKRMWVCQLSSVIINVGVFHLMNEYTRTNNGFLVWALSSCKRFVTCNFYEAFCWEKLHSDFPADSFYQLESCTTSIVPENNIPYRFGINQKFFIPELQKVPTNLIKAAWFLVHSGEHVCQAVGITNQRWHYIFSGVFNFL